MIKLYRLHNIHSLFPHEPGECLVTHVTCGLMQFGVAPPSLHFLSNKLPLSFFAFEGNAFWDLYRLYATRFRFQPDCILFQMDRTSDLSDLNVRLIAFSSLLRI